MSYFLEKIIKILLVAAIAKFGLPRVLVWTLDEALRAHQNIFKTQARLQSALYEKSTKLTR